MSCDTAILCTLRQRGGLSRGQLAEHLNISEHTVGNAITRLRHGGYIRAAGRTNVNGKSVPLWRSSAPIRATANPAAVAPAPYALGYRW